MLYLVRSPLVLLKAVGLALVASLAVASLAAAVPALAGPAGLDLAFEPGLLVPKADPPLPSLAVFPTQLVVDDDSPEGVFGLIGGTARQFLWLNSFANPGPFVLQEIWVLFPAGMDVPLGGAVQLAVFLDPDGDPTNGANLLATYSGVVQVKDGNTFSIYPLGAPLVIDDPGDVLIGVVNRFFTTGVDPPPTQPGAVDTTASQGRSYFALWAGDAPDPPDLASATTIDQLDSVIPGNLMIRGFGGSGVALDIPALGGAGLVLLATVLAAAGIVVGRRRGQA